MNPKIEPPKTLVDKLADVGRTVDKVAGPVSSFLFGSTAKTAGSLIGQGVEQAGKAAGVNLGDTFSKAAQKNITPTNTFFTTLELLPAGDLLSQAIKKVLPEKALTYTSEIFSKIPDALKQNAIEQYSRVLAPTKEWAKNMTAKVVPQLIEKRLTAFTRTGLINKVEAGVNLADDLLEKAIGNIPDVKKIAVQPIVDSLNEMKNQFILKGAGKTGEDVIANSQAVDNIGKFQDIINQIGPDASFSTLRQLRQMWDGIIAKSGGFAGKEFDQGVLKDVMKTATNSVRNTLAKAEPVVAEANKEFTLWKKTLDVLTESAKRKVGQSEGLIARGAEQAGRSVGFLRGRVDDAIVLGSVMKNMVKFMESTGWRTFSAVQKTKLANLLKQGAYKEAEALLQQALIRSRNIFIKKPTE